MRSNGITEIGGTDNLRKKGRDETYTSLMVQGGKSMGIKRSALYFFLGRAGLGGRGWQRWFRSSKVVARETSIQTKERGISKRMRIKEY
jgi:hypothetical protein